MEEPKATETIVPAIAPEEKVGASPEDAQTRFAQLEAEKENYRKAYLKEADKNKSHADDEEGDERMRRIAAETLANSRIAEIAREQDVIIAQALKENKELKLAQLNKTTAPAAMGTHSESTAVTDTLITPDQMKYFKESLKWTDKEIENYKKLQVAKR